MPRMKIRCDARKNRAEIQGAEGAPEPWDSGAEGGPRSLTSVRRYRQRRRNSVFYPYIGVFSDKVYRETVLSDVMPRFLRATLSASVTSGTDVRCAVFNCAKI